MELQLATDLTDTVRIGLLTLRDYRAGPAPAALSARMQSRAAEIRGIWQGRTPGEIPELQPARRLYRAAGIDPTRTRPSSEALVRRALRELPLPRINAAVDLCNLAAITDYLSIGLYDAAKLQPPLSARLGVEGEHYEGLGKPRVNLAGRLCLTDAAGPFGNPSSDSRRTSVDDTTTRLLWVVFAPCDYDPAQLRAHLVAAGELAHELGIAETDGNPRVLPS